MCPIIICRKNRVKDTARKFGATHILSFLDPGDRLVTPRDVPTAHHATFNMDDTHEQSDAYPPTIDHVRAVHGWFETMPADARLLIHCFQGVSRSTAMTFGLLATRFRPEEAAGELRRIRPEATPNRLIIALWDQYLGLHGELSHQVESFPMPSWALPLHLKGIQRQ